MLRKHKKTPVPRSSGEIAILYNTHQESGYKYMMFYKEPRSAARKKQWINGRLYVQNAFYPIAEEKVVLS